MLVLRYTNIPATVIVIYVPGLPLVTRAPCYAVATGQSRPRIEGKLYKAEEKIKQLKEQIRDRVQVPCWGERRSEEGHVIMGTFHEQRSMRLTGWLLG